MAYSFDQSDPRIFRVTFDGPHTDAEFVEYLAESSRHARIRTRRVAVLIDARKGAAMNARQRKQQADWQRVNDRVLRENTAGTAFVVSNSVVRGLLTAIFWLQPLPHEHLVTQSMEEAERWCRARLDGPLPNAASTR